MGVRGHIPRAEAASSDAVVWFAAAARLAASAVDAGRVAPSVEPPVPGDMFAPLGEARWQPIASHAFDAAVAMLQASRPPIATTAGDVTAAAIVAELVDGVVRYRLLRSAWAPELPRDRSSVTAAARAVFRSLTGHDRRLDLPRAVRPDDVAAIGRRFHRTRERAAGRTVVERRVRLVVPDDALDPWGVVLELVDEADPGRWCAAADVWAATPLAVEVANGPERLDALRDELRAFARDVAEVVPAVKPLADQRQPSELELDVDAAADFLEQAPEALGRIGIGILGPESLVRATVAVRGAAVPAPPSDRRGGFNRDTIVNWSLTVADDERSVISEAELARAVETGSTLLHTGRRWVRIDPAALRRARGRLEDYATLTDEAGDGLGAMGLLQLSAEAAAAGDELGLDTDAVDAAATARDAAAWSGRLLGGLPDDQLTEEREPASFVGELRHYQRRGLGWMRFLARLGLGGCLADDMGLGKTATTLAHLLERPGPHLVICPLSVVHNWEQEVGRFAPSLPVTIHHGSQRATFDGGEETPETFPREGIVVTTYGLVTRDVEHLSRVEWGTVVADEAQFVKNPATKAARAIRKLRAAQRIALTGTPVENRLSELWSILDWTNPGMLGSRDRFRHRYSKPIERADDSERAAEAAAALRALTQPFVLRRTKADRTLVPDLPDKIEQVAWAGLTREQAVLYQQIVDQLLEDAAAHTGMKRRSLVLASITKLKQICNHPINATGEDGRIAGRSGKLARFDELVDELLDVDERALVFTQYVTMGNLLQRHVATRLGWNAPFLSGSTPRTRRDALVATFQAGSGPPLLIVSLKAGGTGLNLTSASQVIHYDRWWNPAVENQATDRAWRIGQHQVVTVHKLVCEGTIEERIAQLIDDKQKLADVVVGQGETWLSELTTSQLQELVRLDVAAAVGSGPEAAAGMIA